MCGTAEFGAGSKHPGLKDAQQSYKILFATWSSFRAFCQLSGGLLPQIRRCNCDVKCKRLTNLYRTLSFVQSRYRASAHNNVFRNSPLRSSSKALTPPKSGLDGIYG